METKLFCGKCGNANPSDNIFCYNCGTKLSGRVDEPHTVMPKKSYTDIRVALERLLRTKYGFVSIIKSNFLVQFSIPIKPLLIEEYFAKDKNLIAERKKEQIYMDTNLGAPIPEAGDVDIELKKLSFIREKARKSRSSIVYPDIYYKFILRSDISIDVLIKEIEFIFNNIYYTSLEDYEIATDITEENGFKSTIVKPQDTSTVTQTQLLGCVPLGCNMMVGLGIMILGIILMLAFC